MHPMMHDGRFFRDPAILSTVQGSKPEGDPPIVLVSICLPITDALDKESI